MYLKNYNYYKNIIKGIILYITNLWNIVVFQGLNIQAHYQKTDRKSDRLIYIYFISLPDNKDSNIGIFSQVSCEI